MRVHRAGEGAAYTGLKPAGTIEPPVAAADQAIENGKLQGLAKVIFERTETGLHRQFDQVMAKKKYNPNDVAAGRAYASAYVEFVHYAERLYEAAETMAPEYVEKARGPRLTPIERTNHEIRDSEAASGGAPGTACEARTSDQGARRGRRGAREVARLLHPHFVREERSLCRPWHCCPSSHAAA